MSSKVYYTDARSSSPQTSLVAKMEAVFDAAGFAKLIKPNDVVAIKLHCGEWNNTAYLRPVYARALADKVKSLGGRPFVCDTTTQPYSPYSSRATGLDILNTAERNGYTSAALGCPFICADGFMGTDDHVVDLPEGYILKEAYIAKAIAAADVLITLSHFKGHALGVVGGALKNLGIGAQSKRGKFNVHMGGHPKYGFTKNFIFHPENFKGKKEPDWEAVDNCCPFAAVHVTEDSVVIDQKKCVNCLCCLRTMLSHGIWEATADVFKATNAAIADACMATVKAVGKDKVAFINLAIDIARGCDCISYADTPILPHLGVFGSYDPVAIDKACVDKAVAAMGIMGSTAEEMDVTECGTRKFESCSPLLSGLCEETQINTGAIIGLGSKDYELVDVPEKTMEEVAFAPDPRPTATRLKGAFAKFQVFPYDLHGGQGFKREAEVDLERVSEYDNG